MRTGKKYIRCYVSVLPTSSDGQVRDVRFLGRTQERSTDDEVAVHGDHRTPLWGMVQGVADYHANVVSNRAAQRKTC